MAAGLTAWAAALDEAPALNRVRRLVHAAGRRVAFAVDCACIAACVLGLLTFSLAGFELPTAARLWGGFWAHYADAPPAAREPVLIFMMAVWLLGPGRNGAERGNLPRHQLGRGLHRNGADLHRPVRGLLAI